MMILEFLGICLVNAIIALVSGRPDNSGLPNP